MIPIVWMLKPLPVTCTAKASTAPTAINSRLTPIPMWVPFVGSDAAPAAAEEAEEREDENDDENDPENAHATLRFVWRGVFIRENAPASAGDTGRGGTARKPSVRRYFGRSCPSRPTCACPGSSRKPPASSSTA